MLIVDDHADTRDLARQMLEHEGAMVSETVSPEQAFEIVSSASDHTAARFCEVADAVASLAPSIILDSEVCVF